MTALLLIGLAAAHVLAVWFFIRREQATPTLGEAYRDETLNQHSDPL